MLNRQQIAEVLNIKSSLIH